MLLLDEFSSHEALLIARQTLFSQIAENTIPVVVPKNKELYKPYGVFVTLRKGTELRGCLGRFECGIPLYRLIIEMTCASCLRDLRFMPIESVELGEIRIELSVLSPKTRISDWKSIKLGKVGVMIKKDIYEGVFLPQVQQETGWNLEEFLQNLCIVKAGLPGDAYKDPTTEIYIFEVQVIAEKKSPVCSYIPGKVTV